MIIMHMHAHDIQLKALKKYLKIHINHINAREQ